MPANILNLPRLTVYQVEETDHDYHIKAQASFDPAGCPECKHTSLVGFGRLYTTDCGYPDNEAERLALYDKKDKNARFILFLETQITELNNLQSSLENIPSELHIEHTYISKINRFCSGDFTL